MKDRSVSSADWLSFGGMSLIVVSTILVCTSPEYEMTRNQGIAEYQKALDANIEKPFTMNLNQVRAGLRQWMASYQELKVPVGYTNVFKGVEGALVEANALSERFPTMSAPDYLTDLGGLQEKVQAIRPISAELYRERNPWFSGFFSFLMFGALKLIGVGAVLGSAYAGLIYVGYRLALASNRKGPSPPDTTSSDGGGGGGASSGEPRGSYGSSDYCPPPTYRPPPIGRGW
jgi:hypothetical protein